MPHATQGLAPQNPAPGTAAAPSPGCSQCHGQGPVAIWQQVPTSALLTLGLAVLYLSGLLGNRHWRLQPLTLAQPFQVSKTSPDGCWKFCGIFWSSHKGHFERKSNTKNTEMPIRVFLLIKAQGDSEPSLPQHTQPHLRCSQLLSAFFSWLVEWLGNQFLLSPHFPGTKEKCVSHLFQMAKEG